MYIFHYICHRPPAAGSPPRCRWTGPADRPARTCLHDYTMIYDIITLMQYTY